MISRRRITVCIGLAVVIATGTAAAQHVPSVATSENDSATVHHRFDDVAHWTEVFDDPGRGAWQRPAEVVAALGLEAGDAAADLGAGTGYFEPWLAAAVGADGVVYAVEVELNLVEHIAARARDENLAVVRTILATADDPHLPEAALDAVLVVDTYHHIDHRIEYFRRLAGALKPGGRLAIVDFDPDAPEGPGPGRHHRLAAAEVIRELAAAGWRLERRDDALLTYQYLLIFSLPAG